LSARLARVDLLAQLGSADVPPRATAIISDLLRGRWPLEPLVWRHYVDHVSRAGKTALPDATLARAEIALPEVWRRFSSVVRPASADTSITSGREAVALSSAPLVLMWRRTSNRFEAFLASPSFQARTWFSALPAGTPARTGVGIVDARQAAIWGEGPRVDQPLAARAAIPCAGLMVVAQESTPGARR
jgi:hypothetical protein